MDHKREERSFAITRAGDGESRAVHGLAVVFNSESKDLGGFTEIIAPEAISDELIKASDIKCWLNHDSRRGILARSNKGEGSLKVTRTDVGVEYEFEAPQYALGEELLENLRRGDISQSSFAFWCEEDSWLYRGEGKPYLRTITKIALLDDVSPVYTPAYDATSVANARSLDKDSAEYYAKRMAEAKAQFETEQRAADAEAKTKAEAEQRAKEEAEARAKAEFEEYIANLEKEYIQNAE